MASLLMAFRPSLTIARILLLRSQAAEARVILAKIYPLASQSDIEKKVGVMARAVKQSVASTEGTTLFERLQALFSVGINRRALSE